MKSILIECLILALGVLPNSLAAQTKVEIAVSTDYQNVVQREPIPPDFAGLSFEITSVMPGTGGLAAGVHLFDPKANPQPLALFQQIGIKSLRVGAATGDGCRTPFPSHRDLDALFHFAQQANLKIIYQFRMLNPTSCEIPDLQQQSAETARYIWDHYSQNLAALSTGNEDDYHTAHSFCTDGNACSCIAGKGCSCLRTDLKCTQPRSSRRSPSLRRSPCLRTDLKCTQPRDGQIPPTLVIRDPAIYEVGVSHAMANAGSAFPSYLEEWRKYIETITTIADLAHVPVAGPDAFSYTSDSRFTGNVCGSSFRSAAWPELMAACEESDSKINFLASYGHYYVGGSIGSGQYQLTAAEGIANMLSPAWLQGSDIASEPVQPSGIPQEQQLVYTPYKWLYENDYEPIRKLGAKFRLTESNDYLGGVPNGSNSFASALWALDYMHWWAEHGASGVNFHNNQWIYTDTLVPRNNVWRQPGGCTEGPCTDYFVTPKGYGIKAFNIGGHGYTLETSVQVTNPPKDWSLTAYAVSAGQDLYVTVINKMQGNEPDHVAEVTISPWDAPFTKASVATMVLSSGVAGDASRLTAELGGATISNSGEQWRGAWTPQRVDTDGHVTLVIKPATAEIVRFHVGSMYAGPLGMNENGALELFGADHQGRLWHTWQKSGKDLVSEPNSAADHWSRWSDQFSQELPGLRGGLAVVHNQDNTLQVFAATGKGVYTARQETPSGAWSNWALLGNDGRLLGGLQAAQNADGSLCVVGLDVSGDLWMATEAAPGVAWVPWKKLPKLAGGVQRGFALAENLNGRINVFAVDGSLHPALWRIGQTLNGEWADRWSSLGAPDGQTLQPHVQVGRTITGKLTVFVLDQSGSSKTGNLWTIAQNSLAGPWGPWSAIPILSGLALRSPFLAMQDSDGRFELISAASDGKIYRIAEEEDGQWRKAWAAFAGADAPNLESPIFIGGNTNDGRLQVFATDEKGTVYSIWQKTPGGRWDGNWTVMANPIGLAFNQ